MTAAIHKESQKQEIIFHIEEINMPLQGDFDFHRKRKSAVPMYADGLRLLGFGAFLTVCI